MPPEAQRKGIPFFEEMQTKSYKLLLLFTAFRKPVPQYVYIVFNVHNRFAFEKPEVCSLDK